MEASNLNQITANWLVLFYVLINLPHELYCIGKLFQILLDIIDNFSAVPFGCNITLITYSKNIALQFS